MKNAIYINSDWVTTSQSNSIYTPFNHDFLADIPCVSSEQVQYAIESAKNAEIEMKKLTSLERANILKQIAEGFIDRRQEAAEIISKESGKPLKFSLAEIDRTIETYQFASEEAKRLSGEMIPMDAARNGAGRIGYTVKEPIGIVAAITPFNFPQNLVAHKVAPAIAAGNPIILKPATQTALSALLLAEIISQTYIPQGAFNVITGPGKAIGDLLTASPDIKMITFTGSTDVGKYIRKNAGLKKVSLELGSNAGLIISQTKDLETVAKKSVVGAFSNQGQICISLQRIYVLEDLYEDFMKALILETKQLVLGNPLSMDTDVSAMINANEQIRAQQWVNEAVENGAQLVAGGHIVNGIFQPTILTNVENTSKVSCQEVFAPIVLVNKIKNIQEGVEAINNSTYGLQAGIFTDNIKEAFYAQANLEVGGVIINDVPTYRVDQMPYGGVKESGNTKEGLKYTIDEMTENKLVVWNNN